MQGISGFSRTRVKIAADKTEKIAPSKIFNQKFNDKIPISMKIHCQYFLVVLMGSLNTHFFFLIKHLGVGKGSGEGFTKILVQMCKVRLLPFWPN